MFTPSHDNPPGFNHWAATQPWQTLSTWSSEQTFRILTRSPTNQQLQNKFLLDAGGEKIGLTGFHRSPSATFDQSVCSKLLGRKKHGAFTLVRSLDASLMASLSLLSSPLGDVEGFGCGIDFSHAAVKKTDIAHSASWNYPTSSWPQKLKLVPKTRRGISRRAVFSELQRQRLEDRFQIQKYISKPDRKKLAELLDLKDSQVKVWFQNRRMKWRNCKERELLASRHRMGSRSMLSGAGRKYILEP